MRYQFHFDVVQTYLSWIIKGLGMTIYISVVAMAVALVLGLIVALLRMSRVKPIALLGSLYIEFFRGIPLFVFIIWLYYGLAMVVGINFNPITAGIICLAMQYAGYLAEIYRAGIQAIHKGQREAALSLGLSNAQTFADIILPQALRIIIPPVGNNFVGMLKDSSLVSIVGVFELIRQTQVAVSLTFRPFEFYTVTALIYVGLTLGFSRAMRGVEQRMKL
ncbi:MAG: amino acid ABC transporter permease [Actinobacteria bacterium]|nr:amino acid ABC transporter permease [Actinomycetota bacterium]